MKFFLLLILSISITSLYAQTQKAYITKDGNYTDDPKMGVLYAIIQKLAEDSSYKINVYTMHDTIFSSGTYKDKYMTVPNGKFTQYKRVRLEYDSVDSHKTIDTNYIEKTGYFLNGKRSGSWKEFFPYNRLKAEYTYDNDKLNGLYKNYDIGVIGALEESNYLNDKIEGVSKTYTIDSLLVSETLYKHGNALHQSNHFIQVRPFDGFKEYLEHKLKNYGPVISKSSTPIIVTISVNEQGKITEAEIVSGLNPEIDNAIKNVLLNGPNFEPASYYGNRIKRKGNIKLYIFRPKNESDFIPAYLPPKYQNY